MSSHKPRYQPCPAHCPGMGAAARARSLGCPPATGLHVSTSPRLRRSTGGHRPLAVALPRMRGQVWGGGRIRLKDNQTTYTKGAGNSVPCSPFRLDAGGSGPMPRKGTLQDINDCIRKDGRGCGVQLKRIGGELVFVGGAVKTDGRTYRDGIPLKRLSTLFPQEWVREAIRSTQAP